MTTIQDLFQQAQLAEAAYANFYDASGNLITSDDGVKAALITAGFSKDPNNPTQSAQATVFAARYQVISQQPNTGSGYSATLFLDTTTGQYTYAIRGTEPFFNFDLWVADAGIAMNGLAAGQTVDMYNDWVRINTAPGQPYQALVVESDLLETSAYNLAIKPKVPESISC